MSGCFGDSPEDRYRESQLLDHLDTEEIDLFYCPYCNNEYDEEDKAKECLDICFNNLQ